MKSIGSLALRRVLCALGLGGVLVLGGVSASAAAVSAPAGVDAFIRTYHCPLLEALEAIHAHPMTDLDRYIILEVGETKQQRYVQCRLFEQDRYIECEASSGFYGPRPRPKISAIQRGSIAAQGFSMDGREGNFRLVRPIVSDRDLSDIAALMLRTLYHGYGARLARPIAMKAPFVPGRTLRAGDGSCIPIG